MFPNQFVWAPQYRLPFSGAVEQDIEANLAPFFRAIPAGAGNGQIEQRVFERHSYGSQLDALHQAVRALAGALQQQALPELQALGAMQDEIAAIKATLKPDPLAAAREALQDLARTDQAGYAALLAELHTRS